MYRVDWPVVAVCECAAGGSKIRSTCHLYSPKLTARRKKRREKKDEDDHNDEKQRKSLPRTRCCFGKKKTGNEAEDATELASQP